MVYVSGGVHGRTRFLLFMFRVNLGGLSFSGLYYAFQAET